MGAKWISKDVLPAIFSVVKNSLPNISYRCLGLILKQTCISERLSKIQIRLPRSLKFRGEHSLVFFL